MISTQCLPTAYTEVQRIDFTSYPVVNKANERKGFLVYFVFT